MIESVIFTAIQDIVFFALFVGIAIFFGFAFFRIYKGQPVFMKRASMATEKGIYKAMGVSPREEMTAKKYAFSVLLFSLFGLILMMAILMGQAFLFMNPEQIGGMSWHLAFNTAASFITNTNWQAYSGETQAELSFADALYDRAELLVRRGGHRRIVCAWCAVLRAKNAKRSAISGRISRV